MEIPRINSQLQYGDTIATVDSGQRIAIQTGLVNKARFERLFLHAESH